MTPKHLCILLLALVVVGSVAAQNEEIPLENDNQLPPDNPENVAADVIEGSGDGTIEEPPAVEPVAETTLAPQLEEVQPRNVGLQSAVVSPGEDQSCPKPCVCHYEGGSENFVVDCSGYDLTKIPSPIDPKTTTLNLQNNKLTEISKEISTLKNLKVLNAENNLIMELALGSVSDLPELTVLKLNNNRLIHYPKDLKNSLLLTKLEELDLGGNDMRDEIKPETLSNFKALRKLTLAITTREQLQDLCDSLKGSLETICTESCKSQTFECVGAPPKLEDEQLLDVSLPGTLLFVEENSDTSIKSTNTEDPTTDDIIQKPADINRENENKLPNQALTDNENKLQKNFRIGTFSGTLTENNDQKPSGNKEDILLKTPEEKQNIENPKNENPEADVTVGATTAEGKNGGGGVDKSVIGIVVAGMVVVVAGIMIKKNWTSIKRKFSSSPRPAERAGVNANGETSPEEVPLQDKDKSPV